MPTVPGYPVSGSVSQGPLEVPLGYSSGCAGGVGQAADGESVCADVGVTGGLDVHEIPVLTPGVIHVRVSAPVRFLKASDGQITGVVTQVTASEATIVFKHPLASGSFATVGVNYAGAEYVFVFEPINPVTITSAKCDRSEARVTVITQATGVLSIRVRRSRAGLATSATRQVAPGRSVFRLKLAASGAERCLVTVTLRNQWGTERSASSS